MGVDCVTAEHFCKNSNPLPFWSHFAPSFKNLHGMWPCSSVGWASDWICEGPWFDPERGSVLLCQLSLVEHGSNKPRFGGSSPSWSIIFLVAGLVGFQTKPKWSFIYCGPNYTCPVGATEQRVRLLIWRLWVWVPHGVLFFLLLIAAWLRTKICWTPPVGLEPTISPLGGVRLVH